MVLDAVEITKALLKDRLLNYHTQQHNTSKATAADTTDFRDVTDVDKKTNKYLSKLGLKLTEIKFLSTAIGLQSLILLFKAF